MENALIKESFYDFDAFAHAIQAWDLDCLQLDKGKCKIDMLQLMSRKFLLTSGKFNRQYVQTGSTPPGTWTFVIFSEQTPPIIWHDREISNNNLIVFKLGSEVDCVSKPGFQNYTLSYSEKYLNRICTNLGLPELKNLVNGTDNFEYSTLEIFEKRRQLKQIIDFLHHYTGIKNVSLAHTLEVELPEQILLTLSKSLPTKSNPLRARNHAIKHVKDYLSEFPNEPITVNELCKIAKVSIRTLQYAFLEHYGVTPKTYLKYLRLNNVRRELWLSDSNLTKVNDVSNLCGFWHMGQFAADYRNLFGELPSETLQKVPKLDVPSNMLNRQ